MTLSKRLLLAILSMELLLYTFLYLPVFLLFMIARGINGGPIDLRQQITDGVIIFGPPLLWLALNAWLARKLILMGPFSERHWRTMRFGLKCMGAQAVIMALTFFSFNLFTLFASGAAAIVGLVAATVMESEES